MNVDMAMFHQAFFEEAADILVDLESLLLKLEENPDDLEQLNTIFRCAHSLKGGSATFGFADIAHFTHGLETLLDKVRNGQIPVTKTLSQILFESLDVLKSLLAVARGEVSENPDTTALSARIEAASQGSPAAPPVAAKPEQPAQETVADDDSWGVWGTPERYTLTFVPGHDILREGHDPRHLIARLEHLAEIISLVCHTDTIPDLQHMDPEACYCWWEIECVTESSREDILDIFEFVAEESQITLVAQSQATTQVPDIHQETTDSPVSAPAAKAARPAAAAVSATAPKGDVQSLRVSVEKVDKLVNLVGELVINQSMLNEVAHNFSMAKLPQLLEAVSQMERASRELQERVMAVRMLPIKHAFGRFPRLIRDLGEACGKRIELKMTGEDTELDKTVIEAIGDPLTHLVRNSVDHGLETPADRAAAGKPETGIVGLHALQEGGTIVVEVRDDGRGLNKERILAKARANGWLGENDPAPSDETIYAYIFEPGFSTAQQVTDLSGRGVGMDIVKQAVVGLGGAISLTSVPGEGTTFRIRLPLTMAILEGLSLSVGSEVYVMPLTSIVESIQPKRGDVRSVAGQAEVVMVRGDALPLIRLYDIFGCESQVTDPTQGLLVIVENEGRKAALLVDQLIGQSQVVIKNMETNYRKVEGIAGATILGNGRVALILDIPGLVRSVYTGKTVAAAA